MGHRLDLDGWMDGWMDSLVTGKTDPVSSGQDRML